MANVAFAHSSKTAHDALSGFAQFSLTVTSSASTHCASRLCASAGALRTDIIFSEQYFALSSKNRFSKIELYVNRNIAAAAFFFAVDQVLSFGVRLIYGLGQ